MDITRYTPGADSYDRLSAFQISNFFKRHVLITNDNCNRVAATILGCPISPTSVQGGGSYTVAAVESHQALEVVQFRSEPLDMGLIELARQSYGDFVPKCKHHRMMSEDLCVYVWDLVSGPAFCRVRRQFFSRDTEMEKRLYRTVTDFARSGPRPAKTCC